MTGESAMTPDWKDIERYLSLAGGLVMIFIAFVYAINGAPVFRSDLDSALAVRDIHIQTLRTNAAAQSNDLRILVDRVGEINEGQARIEENLKSVAQGIDRLEGQD